MAKSPSFIVSLLLVVVLTTVVALGGCRRDGEDAPDRPDTAIDDEGFATGETSTGPPTAEALAPQIAVVGPDGGLPEFIAVEFARPVVETAPSSAGKDTLFAIEPSTQGILEFRTPTSLRFIPTTALRPATTYRVTLSAVETPHGVVRPDQPWAREFTTPDFALLSLSTGIYERSSGTVTVHAIFSGPVDPDQLRRFASWRVDGRALSSSTNPPVTYQAGADRHVVRVVFRGVPTKPSAITLDLRAGLPYDDAITAAAATMTASLAEGPPMRILSTRLEETPAGFVVDVVCDDKGSSLPSRYHWDQESFRSHYISGRCLIDGDEARRSLRITTGARAAEGVLTSPTQSGFRIVADLERGTHTLRIDAGTRSVDGGILHEPFEWTFEVGPRKPAFNFVATGRYLPKKHWRNIALRHRNVDTVALTVRHIPPQNLSFWMAGEDETVDARTSRVVVREDVPLRGRADQHVTSFIDISTYLPTPEPGIYEVRARAEGLDDAIRLMVTDMNIIAKRQAPKPGEAYSPRYDVWVLDMGTNALLDDVGVEAIRPSGQSLGRCTTDTTGGCTLHLTEDKLDDTAPIALVARRGKDLTYLTLDALQTRDARARTDGQPFVSDAAYQAAIYGDRGVYRPGESAQVVALIRDRRNVAPGEGLPVELRVFDARQREILRRALATNAAGALSLSIPLADFAVTGAYAVEVRVADQVLATHRFHVEEFVPERLEVNATALTEDYLANEDIAFGVDARYLFGASAAGSTVELHCQLEAALHRPSRHGQYHYGLPERDRDAQPPVDLGTTTATLDATGRAELSCPAIADSVVVDGPSRVVARAAVFEAGSGRTSVAEGAVRVHPAPHYVGLSSLNDDVRVGRPIHVDGVVTDWEGLLLKTIHQVDVSYYKYDWSYNWFYDEETGRETRVQERILTLDGRETVAVVDGKFSLQVTPTDIGAGYLIAVEAQESRTELLLEREGEPWQWYMESQAQRTPRPSRPAPVAIDGPRHIDVGASVTVSFNAPFKGKVLLSAETHEVLSSEWRDVAAGQHSWTFSIDRFAPNIYVSALVIKDPHLESEDAFLPERAFGVQSFAVTPAAFTARVALSVPDEVRSRSPLRAELELGPLDEPTFATVAVVDEGVLAMTRFESPDPLRGIFSRRALGVDTFETVGWALRLPRVGTESAPGGGDDYFEDGVDGADGLGRTMPVRPVALWSGLVEVPSSGKLGLDFDLPLFRGKLRVMAVTMGREKVGRAEAEVIVRDPLTVQTTLPRFLIPHDEAQVPVFVTNLTDARATITVSLEAEVHGTGGDSALTDTGPPIRIAGTAQRTIDVAAGASETVVFPIRALYQSGAARLVVRAKSSAHEVYDEAIVPFIPPGPRQREVKRVALHPGTNDLTPHLTGWVPTSEQTSFWVTAQPHAESFDHLRHLVRYPYGCLEQTTSTLRPMLFASHLLGQVDPTLAAGDGELEGMVRAGIDRILSMRHPGGGFTYWPGASYVEPWSSTYATHLLLDADRQGYALPGGVLDEALRYLENHVVGASAGQDTTEPYAHYVLAMAGKGQRARITRLLDQLPAAPQGRKAEVAYMLKAALYLTGDRRYERDLKAVDTTPLAANRELGYPFYSDLRYRGFMLNVFFDLFGNDSAGAPLAERVARGLATHRASHFSTQELAWATTGLGKWYAGLAASFGPARLVANGRPIDPLTSIADRPDRSWALTRASEYKSLELVIDAPGEHPVYALLSSEGVRTSGFVPLGGQGLTLNREYLDANGNPLSEHHLGDLVYVRVTLTNTHGTDLRNIALVDRFPAGWEIELTDLGRDRTLPGWARDADHWEVAHASMRDDRVEVFGDLARGQQKVFLYTLRAVTAGDFHVPTIDAEAMYDPRIWAREAGRKIQIDGPWEILVD